MVFIRLMDNSHSAIDIDNQNIIFKKTKYGLIILSAYKLQTKS